MALLSAPLLADSIQPKMSVPKKVILEDDYSKSGKNMFARKNFITKDGALQIIDHDPKVHSANSHTKFGHKNYIVSFDLYLEDEKSTFGFYLGGGHGLGFTFNKGKFAIKNGKIQREAIKLPTKQWIPVVVERVGNELVFQIVSSKNTFYTTGAKLNEALDSIGIKCFGGTYKLDNFKAWESEIKSDWASIKSSVIKS